MSTKLVIPAKQLKYFVDSAGKWLSKTADHKASGLDIAIEAVHDKMILSVGGDSSFLEASFKITPIETPFTKIYIDLAYMMKLPMDEEGDVIVTKPSEIKNDATIDYRLALRYSGMNFKIPLKKGDVWEKNKHDFTKHVLTSFVSINDKESFDRIYKESILPHSFGIKQKNILTFHKKEKGVFVYTSDGYGAFCHEFKGSGVTFSEGSENVPVMHEFFVPIAKMKELKSLKVFTSERYLLGSAQTELFETFHWVQPKSQEYIEDIEEFVSKSLTETHSKVKVETKDFFQVIKNTMVFFKDSNIRDTPLQFIGLQGKYSMSAALPLTHTSIEGVLLENLETPIQIRFHAASIRDYVGMMEMDLPLTLLVYDTKVFLVQETESIKMQYLIPIAER